MEISVGTVLGERYRLIRELGRGGNATVHLADDLRHDRRVAVKVLHAHLAEAVGPERFLDEIRTTARLRHPHILPLYDSGRWNGAPYYVMPEVVGESLRDRLDREGALPMGEAIRLTCEVANALDHAHHHGVIHRDIKPENILLDGGHAVVADFGIARALGTGAAARMTQEGDDYRNPVVPQSRASGRRPRNRRAGRHLCVGVYLLRDAHRAAAFLWHVGSRPAA